MVSSPSSHRFFVHAHAKSEGLHGQLHDAGQLDRGLAGTAFRPGPLVSAGRARADPCTCRPHSNALGRSRGWSLGPGLARLRHARASAGTRCFREHRLADNYWQMRPRLRQMPPSGGCDDQRCGHQHPVSSRNFFRSSVAIWLRGLPIVDICRKRSSHRAQLFAPRDGSLSWHVACTRVPPLHVAAD